MPLPLPPNTTCDIYEPGNSPPATPDSEGVACYLKPCYAQGLEVGDEAQLGEIESKYTHVLLLDAGVTTVQDGHDAATFGILQCSTVYVPDKDGTAFFAVFVERAHAGTALDHKRVYLRRHTVNWPTDEL